MESKSKYRQIVDALMEHHHTYSDEQIAALIDADVALVVRARKSLVRSGQIPVSQQDESTVETTSLTLVTTSRFRVHSTGIIASGEFSQDEWAELGFELANRKNLLLWVVGDWLLLGSTAGYLPRGKLANACETFGIEYRTAKCAASVCRAFPERFRRLDLSFGHHQSVAGSELAEALLDWADETNATILQLRAEKRRRESELSLRAVNEPCASTARWEFMLGDCENLPFEADSFDLVFCSPPYEGQRTYEELEFNLTGEAWVEWAVRCYLECSRVSRGLVAWVVSGVTEDFEYSATPELLMASLKKHGVKLRKPLIYHRQGIPGTGGADWFRNDYEIVVCSTKAGRLPWSDNTALGSPPVSQQARVSTNRKRNGVRKDSIYRDPEVVNPGDVIHVDVGNGNLGWKDAHLNEAPFPEALAERFIRSFCPPGGRVLDPFSGSGTTVATAVKFGRVGLGIDKRPSQVALATRRLRELDVAANINEHGSE